MRKLVGTLIALLLTGLTWADVTIDRTENWANATQNVDGSPYVDASHTNFYYSTPSGWNLTETVVDPALVITTATFTFDVPPNEIITVQATHVDLVGNESILGNMVSFGPFAQTDVVEPSAPGLAPGSSTIVGCPPGFVCVQL